ncbi:MAG: cytochrome P450 [Chloroflexota bacterium]
MTDITAFDFKAHDFIQNPYPYYQQLRDAPIHYREDWQFWLISRYADVNALLRDKRLGREPLPSTIQSPPARYQPFYEMQANSLMEREPPVHTRLKSLVHKAFTPRTVQQLKQRIHDMSHTLLDKAGNQFDVLEAFAVPLSVTVIAELLGVPESERHPLRGWSHDIVQMYEIGGQSSDVVAMRSVQAVEEFSDYLRDLIARKRAHPQEDLLTALVQAEEQGNKLSEAELIATCILILNAGHEATVNVLGNGLYALLKHPESMRKLRQHSDLLPTVIEEMMRYDTPLPMFRRWLYDDVELHSITMKKGQEVALFLASANHDPAEFEHPEQFNITRQHNPHLSFGMGIHYCLGAPLARLELQIALHALLDRTESIHLTEDVAYHDTFVFRGLQSLPIYCD